MTLGAKEVVALGYVPIPYFWYLPGPPGKSRQTLGSGACLKNLTSLGSLPDSKTDRLASTYLPAVYFLWDGLLQFSQSYFVSPYG